MVFQRFFGAIRREIDPIGHARSLGVTVGEGCRLIRVTFSREPYLVKLGNHVSATRTHFETHDGGVWVLREQFPDIDIVRPIEVGNNVYFGHGCVVLPGVRIGDNVVIGAGAVVARDIPDNCVSGGVPAKVIKSLDAYAEKVLRSGESTKRMTLKDKRDFYMKKYGSQLDRSS